jgi:glycosyltransferase involved in cell wall biosynthesis
MFSVLLPVYNGERFLKKSIDSILNQTYKNFELLIGFNGTKDRSKEIVESYSDSRIKTFDYGDETGKCKTLNKLFNESQYEWIANQDDDDIWMPDKLQRQANYINEYDVVGTFIKYINENDEIIGNPTLSVSNQNIINLTLNGTNQIANSSAIFKKDLNFTWKNELDDLPLKGIQPMEDLELWVRMMKNNKKFINIPEFLVHHRLHNKSNFNTLKK